LLVGNTFAQSYGIGGGIDILNPVNRGFYIPGLTVFVDIPRNETVVPFGKIGYFFPISVDNPNGVQLGGLRSYDQSLLSPRQLRKIGLVFSTLNLVQSIL
jgi:hypothetical protein